MLHPNLANPNPNATPPGAERRSAHAEPARFARHAELLPSAAQVRAEQPAEAHRQRIGAHRQAIAELLAGRDPRLLVVIGPCSIDEPRAALEYAGFLQQIQRQCPSLLLCMRTYLEKPRTTVGWKGLIYDPHLDGSHDVSHGIRVSRELLRSVSQLDIPAATELLDPVLFPYVEDLISWAAVGARTTESQLHRQAVSALPLPVGFKNATDGNVGVAIDSIRAAAAPHAFPALSSSGALSLCRSSGNPDTHLILRGGSRGPNYQPGDVQRAHDALRQAGIEPRRVMIDCSHGNSNKDYRRQPQVASCVADQVRRRSPLAGVMIESYLVDGNQRLEPGRQRRYGQSITDGCIGLEQTRDVLLRLADAAAVR